MTIDRHSKAARRFLVAGAAGMLFATPVAMHFGALKAGEPASGANSHKLEQILTREIEAIPAETAAPTPTAAESAMPIIRVAHTTDAPQPHPRSNQSQRVRHMESAVQQHLEQLRQADGRTDVPRFVVPQELYESARQAREQQGGYVSPRKRTFTDWLKPRTWRRRFTRNQNAEPVYQQPVQGVETGAPAPLPQAVPPAMTATQPAPQPVAEPAEEIKLPQVSPEIFTLESEPRPQPQPFPGLAESDEPADAPAADAAPAGKPQIEFFFAQPEPETTPFAEPQAAPPAEPLPVAEQPAVVTEARPELELPGQGPSPAAELTSESDNPFTGLELEPVPYAAPQQAAQPDRRSVTTEKPAAPVGGPALSGPGRKGAPGELPQVSQQRPLAGTGVNVGSTTREKMELIAARRGLKGFKGFCPVMLRDHRELVNASLDHSAVYHGKTYWFSSAEAKEAFLAAPEAYAPANGGIDLVHFSQTGEKTDGSLDHAVWFRGQLYLFSSDANKEEFKSAPRDHLPSN